MKKWIKCLIPSMGLIATATTIGCACTTHKEKDGYIALEQKYFVIDNNKLQDFKDEYKDQSTFEKGHYKLKVFKDITALDDSAFSVTNEYTSPLLIEKVDYAQDCACESFGLAAFAGCTNLKEVIFPPKFNTFGLSIFSGCSSLSLLDVSNIEGSVTTDDWYITGISKTGKITYLSSKPNQVTFATWLRDKINATLGNNWTLDPQ